MNGYTFLFWVAFILTWMAVAFVLHDKYYSAHTSTRTALKSIQVAWAFVAFLFPDSCLSEVALKRSVGDSILHFMAAIGSLALCVLLYLTGYYIWLLFHPNEDKKANHENQS